MDQNTGFFLKEKLLKNENFIMILIPLIFGIIYLSANMSNSNFYSYFFDEFYYLDCVKNLSFGYVDHPPFSIYILFIWTNLFGTTLISIRVLITLLSAIIIFVTGRVKRKILIMRN
jgi:hypothetical protein